VWLQQYAHTQRRKQLQERVDTDPVWIALDPRNSGLIDTDDATELCLG
jgi:hypothetical protein